VNTTGTPPSPRSDHSIAVVDKFIYVFGGSDEKVTPLNDVHVLDTETLTWTAVETKGQSPSPRSGHTTVAIGSKVFYFGGAKWNPSSSQWVSKSNELYLFDTVTCSWSKPSTTGKSPSVSTFAASFVFGRHIWLIGGGKTDGDFVSDTIYILDTVTLRWDVPKISGFFLAKDCISATVVGNCVLLFGGYRGDPVNELQVLEMVWHDKMTNCKLSAGT